MIKILINPARVEAIYFEAASVVEEDLDFAAWQAIRPLVDKIDRRLRRIIASIPTNDKESSPVEAQ